MEFRRELALGRRSFLAHAGLVVLGAGASAIVVGRSSAAVTQPGDIGVIQTALALEHEGIAAYRIAGQSGLLSPRTLKLALVFLGHHQMHRDSLAQLVADAGGKPVEPKADAQYIADLQLGSLKTEGDVVALATTLERGAATAYVGQIAALSEPKLAQLFASISADEAVHWTTLNNAAGKSVPTSAYLFGR